MKRRNPAEWAILNRQIIYFFILASILGGLWCYFNLGRSESPNYTIRQMVVTAAWPGASAEEITKQVTDPLERKLQDTPGLDYLKSFTHDGKTVIYVNLKDEVPAEETRTRWHEIRNMVADEWGNLPAGVKGPFINDRFDDVYGSIYAVTGNDFSYEEKRAYAEAIRRRLQQVPDVQKVELLGVQEQTIYVEMDQNKLASFGIAPTQVFQILQQQGMMMPSGMIHTSARDVAIRVDGLLPVKEALEAIPLHVGERSFRLGDVASVTQAYAEPETALMYFNGKPAVGIAVSMALGGNNLTLGRNLEESLAEYRSQLPAGLDVELAADQPKVVNDSIEEFTRSLMEAIVIVLAVSFLSLGVRSGIVVALCIPVVVCATFIFMEIQGIDLHIVSLGALIVALGLLVDDAIIVVEMMQVKLEEGYSRMEAAEAAYKACAFPMLSGTLITAAGFIPVGLAKGSVSEYTNALFWVVVAALLLSWAASILVSPVLGHAIIRIGKENPKKAAFRERAYTLFRRLIRQCIHYRKSVVIGTAAVFAGTLCLFPLVNRQFFPPSVRPELILDVNLPSGASIASAKDVMEGISGMLYGDRRVASFSTYIGDSAPRFILLFEPLPPENGHGQMIIVAQNQKARDSLRPELLQRIADQYPEVRAHIRLVTTGPPFEYPIMLRVKGPDEAMTAALAEKALAQVETNPHIINASLDWPEETPAVRLSINQDKVRELGIDNYAVSQDLYVKLSGYKVSESYQGDQLVPISFRLSGKNSERLGSLSSIPIHVGNGRYVPLGEFADISYENETSTIWRRNLEPTVTIRAEVTGGATEDSVAEELYSRTLADFRKTLPAGYTLEKGGSLEQSDKTLGQIAGPVPVMVFLMLAILMFQLKSIPLMAMATVTAPLGMIGTVLTLAASRAPLGFVAIIGVIALGGMIIRNSIILLDQIRQHHEAGEDPYHSVVDAAVIRFRPIMLTAMAAILGMIPLMGNPFWSPMAFGFSGGLLVATVLTLLFLPALYCWYYKVEEPGAAT